jgi:D-glycero-alpha-D-manno-heptose-7-phosphate kinase
VIICRTPTRISFFGGGTDYPAWYQDHGGMVLSTSINKYSYITVRYLPKFFDYKYRVRYYKTEETQTLEEIQHPSVRECARHLEITQGIEVVHNGDLPAGTGLGSSSTFTVGMLHALYALKNYMPTKRELALKALYVEQQLIGEAVGSQDQVAAAWGGFNRIKFGGDHVFEVDPIIISRDREIDLQDNLLLCFTGFARSAPAIAAHQIMETAQRVRELEEMQNLTDEALKVLTDTSTSLDVFGELLGHQWNIKRSLTEHISNPDIDDIYRLGIQKGALGGKLLGAGGGGFMLFYAPKERHEAIKSALSMKLFVPFRFEDTGSKIVYYSHE